jgi:hypothetical protein
VPEEEKKKKRPLVTSRQLAAYKETATYALAAAFFLAVALFVLLFRFCASFASRAFLRFQVIFVGDAITLTPYYILKIGDPEGTEDTKSGQP